MKMYDFSAFAFLHTGQEIIKALMTHMNLSEPKLESFGKVLRESRHIFHSTELQTLRKVDKEGALRLGSSNINEVEENADLKEFETEETESICYLPPHQEQSLEDNSQELEESIDWTNIPSDPVHPVFIIVRGIFCTYIYPQAGLSSVFFAFKRRKFQAVLNEIDHFQAEWQSVDKRVCDSVKSLSESGDYHRRRYVCLFSQ